MKYPTLKEVNAASHYRICFWWRFLPSPGTSAIGRSEAVFQQILGTEVLVMNRIAERFKELGGFTPEISKSIGWESL